MDTASSPPSRRHLLAGAALWLCAVPTLLALDGPLDLANLALLLVLAAALAALWWPAPLALAGSVVAVVWFNWRFVPPRGTFHVDSAEHAVLLVAMALVSGLVSALMVALRRRAADAQRLARRAEQLHAWGEALRDSAEPLTQAGALQAALAEASGTPVALLLLREGLPRDNDEAAVLRLGEADADQRAGLWHALRQRQALGPGTGRHAEQPDLYLPLRARAAAHGAALLGAPGRAVSGDPAGLAHLQALCDGLGLALQRAQAQREAQQAREAAQTQGVRAALLAAISHDHRTPLATIVGAASSLVEQDDRLSPAQRRELARRIVDEAGRLARLTDNTLQLARLDAPGVQLRCDWESAEELAGVALRRARQAPGGARVRARIEPGLPLLWCDALLIAQLLDNLIDNALKYSPDEAPVELLLRRQGEQLLLAVRDRGPGIAPAWRERVFEVFHRGAEAMPGGVAVDARTDAGPAPGPDPDRPRHGAGAGAGVGLAVCRAIARAHGGELRLRARGHGGSSFECRLPLHEPPAGPIEPPAGPIKPPAAPVEPTAVPRVIDA